MWSVTRRCIGRRAVRPPRRARSSASGGDGDASARIGASGVRGAAAVQALLSDPAQFDQSRIRNLSVVAHIDHGKTTLSGALLELTETMAVHADKLNLDGLATERARGITIKAHIVSLLVQRAGDGVYLLNLIDTPGHVDFAYEVSRALSACEGAVLLVDATQGVQAQTLANYELARRLHLSVVPALNKIDAPGVDVDAALEQLTFECELDPALTLLVSARQSRGIAALLDAVIDRVPPPSASPDAAPSDAPLRALLIDSYYDRYLGVVCLVRVFGGVLERGAAVRFASTGAVYQVQECGIMHPDRTPLQRLESGMVGYMVAGVRETREARVGDTLLDGAAAPEHASVAPLRGFQQPQPMLFAGIFPEDTDAFDQLRDAVSRLTLNDASVRAVPTSSSALGPGFRCGFLGALHFEVFCERLADEYGIRVVATRPSVPFMVRRRVTSADTKKSKASRGEALGELVEEVFDSPSDFPPPDRVKSVELLEPMCVATVVCPGDMQGQVMTLMSDARGTPLDTTIIGGGSAAGGSGGEPSVRLRYKLPMAALVSDGLASRLKAQTRGYASLDYERAEYAPADLVRLDIRIADEPVDAFACVVERSQARQVGISVLARLKDVMPRQLFVVALQAAIGNKIIARETVKALRKDVTAKLYGGDVTRKNKLLEKQKAGKKRMRKLGGVTLDKDVFLKILKQPANE